MTNAFVDTASEILTGWLVAVPTMIGIVLADQAPAPYVPTFEAKETSAFECVLPYYVTGWGMNDNGSLVESEEFIGYVQCPIKMKDI